MAKLISVSNKRKIAFVCSGGATKAGAFHIGVALALQEKGFRFIGGLKPRVADPGPWDIATYVGSSAGSVIASYLAAGYSIENVFNSFLGKESHHPKDRIPKVLPSLSYKTMFRLRKELANEQLKILTSLFRTIRLERENILKLDWIKITGIFSTHGVEEFLREQVLISNDFKDYIPDLFIVGTQLNHSRKVVFGKYALTPPPHDPSCAYENSVGISQACAASTALPLIYTPYPIQLANESEPTHFIDGEIRDTLSTHVAIDSGCDLIFSSHTHQPYHFKESTGSLTKHGIPAIVIQSIYLMIEQKINYHIHSKEVAKTALHKVEKILKQHGVAQNIANEVLDTMIKELHVGKNVDTIYFHPTPDDTEMFFGEHFSLSPEVLAKMVRSGFRAAQEILKNYRFDGLGS